MFENLKALGVNTDEALQRMMGNSDLYKRMLTKLTEEISKLEVLPYLEQEDYDVALQNAHTLKGVTANLGVTPLYDGYSKVVLQLRANDYSGALSTMTGLMPVQQQVVDCISQGC